MTAWLMHGAGMARTQNAQTFTGQPLALQVEYGLFDKQHGQTLDLGFGRDWSSQPLAVIFLPAVGSSLPWHGQLWRRTPTLMGHSQGWLGTAHGHAWQHSAKRKNTARGRAWQI